MVVEEALVQYGVLGLWTASLLWERFKTQKNQMKVIENNTIAITKINEIIKKCERRN